MLFTTSELCRRDVEFLQENETFNLLLYRTTYKRNIEDLNLEFICQEPSKHLRDSLPKYAILLEKFIFVFLIYLNYP